MLCEYIMNIQYKVNVKRLKIFLSEVGLGFGSVYSCYAHLWHFFSTESLTLTLTLD